MEIEDKMKEIEITQDHQDFVAIHSPDLDIGGFSNLNNDDLSKASRLDYQYTGLYGELAWYMYRYNSTNKLKDLLNIKLNTCKKAGIGDNGYDDSITSNNKTRLVDIKTSHITDINKINNLNLIIPPRELHTNMIYICAFSIGKNRRNVNKVILSGWCINEDIKDKWKYDTNKFCVPVLKLRDMTTIDQYIK